MIFEPAGAMCEVLKTCRVIYRAAIDARPSDSIALAVRFGCPIFVADAVFEEASVEVTEVDEEEEVERFRDFLDHVDPSDFMS